MLTFSCNKAARKVVFNSIVTYTLLFVLFIEYLSLRLNRLINEILNLNYLKSIYFIAEVRIIRLNSTIKSINSATNNNAYSNCFLPVRSQGRFLRYYNYNTSDISLLLH